MCSSVHLSIPLLVTSIQLRLSCFAELFAMRSFSRPGLFVCWPFEVGLDSLGCGRAQTVGQCALDLTAVTSLDEVSLTAERGHVDTQSSAVEFSYHKGLKPHFS
jgi:hypothetical protein